MSSHPMLPWGVLFSVCCPLFAWGAEIPPQPLDGNISWVYSYEEGKRLARENGKPLFVVFRCER